MTKSKKIGILILSILLAMASLLFVACGEVDYSNTYLTASEYNIEMFVGDSESVVISIVNPVGNMSNNLLYSSTNSNIIEINKAGSNGYSTTYNILGKSGGNSTITFTSQEGDKSLSISIYVREYSDKLIANTNNLYISASNNKLSPSPSDFIFSENATERELEYYFYGQKFDNSVITSEDLKVGENLINNFVDIILYSKNGNDYLIFKDKDGLFHTLGRETIVAGSNNKKYEFIVASQEGEDFSFDESIAYVVSAGQKFTFLAQYSGVEGSEPKYCERSFSLLIDINQSDFSHEYGYKITDIEYVAGAENKSYKIEDICKGQISLVPNYKTIIMDNPLLIGEEADYSTVYLEVKIASNNPLLKLQVEFQDTTIANGKYNCLTNGESITYYVEINCGGKGGQTSFNMHFYYEGFKNSEDENVNFVYSVPIEIRIIPTKLLVNNIDLNEVSKIYKFYNVNYNDGGWQEFNFSILQEGAEFDSLIIDLTNSGLQARYMNIDYDTGILEVKNLKQPVYIRGQDNANLVEEQNLPVTLNYSVVREDSLQTNIKYTIVKGATIFDFQTQEYKSAIYIDSNQDEVLFDDIYANAEFEKINFSLSSGNDVVKLSYDSNNLYNFENDNYYLNIKISPIVNEGTGTYTISLDNGKQIPITIIVSESLTDVYLTTKVENNCVRYFENNTTIEGEFETVVYVYNKNGESCFDLTVIANDNKNSKAIRGIYFVEESDLITVGQQDNIYSFIVYANKNGTADLTLNIQGYEIKDFKRTTTKVAYQVTIIIFDYIENLNVYKTKDGLNDYEENTSASYVSVYSNTNDDNSREAVFQIKVQNNEAYLFANPETNEFVDSEYNENFVYFESDARIYKGSAVVDRMYFSLTENSVYTIGEYGTFDTQYNTFTAFSNLQNSGSFKIITHVKQYGKIYSFTINIKILMYEKVERVTLQTPIEEIEFSALEREFSLIAYPTNATATNGQIVALFNEGTIIVDDKTYSILDTHDENSVSYIESDGKTLISLNVLQDFLEKSVGQTQSMKGELLIVAKDWLDAGGNLLNSYQELALHITIRFANGTETNRFTINDTNDLLAIKDNLSAHYQIKTTIDASSITNKLPLGELKGSIVGTNQYAIITGINITNAIVEETGGVDYNYYGLFSKIATNAYIEYIQINGQFNIGNSNSPISGESCIGLFAGVNNGKLINVGSEISYSNIYINYGSFGGLVGVNNGQILQDFTLFEDNSSKTRSETVDNLKNNGRYSYQKLTPKITVFMNDFVNVKYMVQNDLNCITRIGGMVGINNGVIKKIDSQILSFNGYTNYMAYSMIKATPINLSQLNSSSTNYLIGIVGGLVGETKITEVSGNGRIIAGFNSIDLSNNLQFNTYDEYKFIDGTTQIGNFTAGNGIVVGGEIWGYGYIGGVVGRISKIFNEKDFAGISSRTFVRGQKAGDSVANIAVIANIESIAFGVGLTNAFSIQAVDDGRVGEEASMALLYNGDLTGVDNYLTNVNIIGFGNFSIGTDVLRGFDGSVSTASNPINVFTYVISRKYISFKPGAEIKIINANKQEYYGDFIILGTNEGTKTVIAQTAFTKGSENDLSINAKFNNKFTPSLNKNNIYYAYYFQAVSSSNDDLANIQAELDKKLNKLDVNSDLYPFIANGEMTFVSKTTDIITIDQTGKINIKGVGLAQIIATSVLNTNNALNFYIYVTNYFNSQSTIEDNSQRNSIIYPDISSSSTAIDNTIIKLRGNNTASLYIKPEYTYTLNDIDTGKTIFNSDPFGLASLNGVIFNLANNSDVTASVIETSGAKNLDIEVAGQTIIIRRTTNTSEAVYSLTIQPRLEIKFEEDNEEVIYSAYVNKTLNDTVVDYKQGAIEISNKNYNNAPIQSSKTIVEEITVFSTASDEENPLYYIVGLDGRTLQGNIDDYNYVLNDNERLFNITFNNGVVVSEGNGVYQHKFKLEISINTSLASYYQKRYEENIFGRYYLYIQASSNSSKNLMIAIDFEKTGVTSVVIDNYKSLSDASDNSGLTSTTNYAYPGESGLLAITINPEDSDFDYILIENDESNYQSGKASAIFSVVAKRESATGGYDLFDNSKVSGILTSKGIQITQEELLNAYSGDYETYRGIIYIRYDMSSKNVIDGSTSKINVKVVNTVINDLGEIELYEYPVSKTLTIKLQNYVGIEIEGKEGLYNQSGYYMTYDVARGLKYKLNLNSYGFSKENISISLSNDSLANIIYENGEYYIQITKSAITYTNNANEFDIIVSATQQEGEVSRVAESKTHIVINEFVLNYNGEIIDNEDIISGMGEGVINLQVGSQITLNVDIYDYIEYDSTINGVVEKIEDLMIELSTVGQWRAITNLISDDQPNYKMAEDNEKTKTYLLGFDEHNQTITNNNYYFKSSGLNLTAIRTHIPEEKFYYFEYTCYIELNNGSYRVYYTGDDRAKLSQRIHTTFVLNVYSSSSDASPIPVYDYDDFTKMQSGGYYILLNDITLPNVNDEKNNITAFTPKAGNFASFDGNGHSINFAGTYNMGSLSEIGLFSSLSEGSIIKNLIVNYSFADDGSDLNTNPNDTIYGLYNKRTVKFITTSDSFTFGSIVAKNEGIITNCQVLSASDYNDEIYLTVKADNALTGSSYIGGIAGSNNGFITNCAVSINVKAPFNVAGVVAQNYKKISSSYFKEGKLINNSQYSQNVSGFAIVNSENAQIITSYVAGAQSNDNLYSKDNESYIISSISASGFIFENNGTIKDCYIDIDLSKTTSEMAGFVYRNSGTVKNSFSLAILRNNTTASAGFARENIYGTFENCYYYYHRDSDPSKNINTSLYDVSYDGIKALTDEDFKNLDEYFADYSYTESISTQSVWFYSTRNTSNDFVDYLPSTESIVINTEEGKTQTNTLYKSKIMTFGINRLELVSPNIKALSIRNFDYSEVDNVSGNITYHYIDDSNVPNSGTLHNPRLLYDAVTMEDEIKNATSLSNINTTSYRIISDISYNEFEGHSTNYDIIYAGILEGNGMSISDISLVSMDKQDNGGLFGQVGYSANKKGSIKNLSVTASEVAFSNTANVGIIAGTLKYGYLYDITVAMQGNSSTIAGLNFVGGIVGRAVTNFEMKDLYSSTNVSANYSSNDYEYQENGGSIYSSSYAGSIAGFVGNGNVYNAHVSNVSSIMGGYAGFAYGGIGREANVSYTFVDVKTEAKIKAYHYGGLIVGGVAGNLYYSYVSDNGNIETPFANIPKIAKAAGGIAGILRGGKISNAIICQDFRVVSNENNQTINNVGGIVGLVQADDYTVSKIEECVVECDITSSSTLGGGVGTINTALQADKIAVKSNLLTVKGQKANPYLGGIVANLTNQSHASLEMKNSYCLADLAIETSTSGVQSTAVVGGLIGNAWRTPKLSYCFTTSRIDATVYDSRQIGSLSEFNEQTNASFTYSEYSTNCDKVYYFGGTTNSNVNPNQNDVYNSNKNFLSFNTKVKSVAIGLKVNNFGQSSMEYVNELGLSSLGSSTNKESLHNLFGETYQLKDDKQVLNFAYSSENDIYINNSNEFIKEQSQSEKIYYHNLDVSLEGEISKEFLDSLTVCNANQSNSDMYRCYIDKTNSSYYYNKTTDADKNLTYTFTNVQNGNQTTYKYTKSNNNFVKQSGEDIDFSRFYLHEEFNAESLIQNLVYGDNNGNYYLKGYTNISNITYLSYTDLASKIIYVYDEENNKFQGYQKLSEISYQKIDGYMLDYQPNELVWITSSNNFSYLNFELTFNWLNKI